MKGYNSGTATWKRCIGQGIGKGCRASTPSPSVPLSPDLQVLTNLEALRTLLASIVSDERSAVFLSLFLYMWCVFFLWLPSRFSLHFCFYQFKCIVCVRVFFCFLKFWLGFSELLGYVVKCLFLLLLLKQISATVSSCISFDSFDIDLQPIDALFSFFPFVF